MIIIRRGVESVHNHVHNTRFASLQGPVNPFTAPAGKISGLREKCTYTACKQHIFWYYNKSTFSSILCALMKIRSHANVKKRTKRLKDSAPLLAIFKWHHGSRKVKGDLTLTFWWSQFVTDNFFCFVCLLKLQHCEQRDLVINISLLFQFWYSILIYSHWFFPSKNTTCTPWQ